MATTKFKPYLQTTIDGVIEAGKALTVSESSISFKSVIADENNGNVAVRYHNVITKYHNVIKPFIEDTILSDEELQKYKHKPNLYCHDIYGTPELAFSLLYINNMVSVTEFTKSKFKKFNSSILTIVNELLAINDTDLKLNRLQNNIE